MQPLDMADIGRAVKARHVATALTEAHTVAPDDSVASATAALMRRQFDYAPVVERDRVVGLLRADTPSSGGTVRAAMDPITPDLLVSAETPLTSLVKLLCERELLLMLEEHAISGLITRSDLGSAPARTHYYLRLASAEMHLAQYLRARYPRQSDAIAQLSPKARERHQRTVKDLREADTYLDDVSALSFADLVHLAGKDPAFREHAIRLADRGWRWLSDGIAVFRNDIMHPARDIAAMSDVDVTRLADAEVRITALSGAALAALRTHDAAEQQATTA